MRGPVPIGKTDERCLASERAKSAALGQIKALEDVIKQCQVGAGVWARGDRYATELASIKAEYKPQMTVAVLGATGAGKSSLINAILEDEIVPTSGMAACTSVVTEISYNERNSYEADVHFLTEVEWRKEILVLLDDLQDNQDGEETDRFSQWGNSTSPSPGDLTVNIARDKIHAVYPSLALDTLSTSDVDSVLNRSSEVSKLLGTTVHIEAATSTELAWTMAPYIVSQEQDRGHEGYPSMAYWPLIRQLKVRCPARALSTGIVLVDLPGIADANAARASIAGEYMQKCDHFWIAAPVTRAVNDKTAHELLGRAFRVQMLMDGKLDPKAFTFIVTKCDDISPKEITRALHLGDDLQYKKLQDNIKHHKAWVSKWKNQENTAKNTARDMGKTVDDLKAQLKGLKQRLDASGSLSSTSNPFKHARPDDCEPPGNERKQPCDDKSTTSGSGFVLVPDKAPDSPGESSGSSQTAHELQSLQKKINDDAAKLEILQRSMQEIKEKLREEQDGLQHARMMLNAFCASERSKCTTRMIQVDFRAGVAEQGINVSQDIPVFTISARDFMRLSADGDEVVQCFTNEEDTKVPALQQWCHTLALPVREAATKRLFVRLRVFAKSLRSFVEDSPGVKSDDRDAMILQWESPMEDCSERDFRSRKTRHQKAKEYNFQGITWRLINDFREIVNTCVCELQDTAEECLQVKCEEATDMASKVALKISDDFAASMHWQTYLATIRRDGSWWRGNLNSELLTPFSSHIAAGWCEMFAKDFFSSFQSEALRVVSSVTNEVVETVPDYLERRAETQSKVCLAEAHAALEDIVPMVQRAVQSHRKAISRRLAPRIEAELLYGYDLAKVERGRGCVARQKAIIHDYVDEKRYKAFQVAANDLTEGLKQAANTIGGQLDDALAEVARTVEKNMSILWDGPILLNDDRDDAVVFRMRMIGLLDEIVSQIDSQTAA